MVGCTCLWFLRSLLECPLLHFFVFLWFGISPLPNLIFEFIFQIKRTWSIVIWTLDLRVSSHLLTPKATVPWLRYRELFNMCFHQLSRVEDAFLCQQGFCNKSKNALICLVFFNVASKSCQNVQRHVLKQISTSGWRA